jgi:hypothetical protein
VVKELAIGLLFSAGDAGAIYVDPSLDITGEIIKRFDSAKPAPATTAKPAAPTAKPAATATDKPAAPSTAKPTPPTPPAAAPATQKPAPAKP